MEKNYITQNETSSIILNSNETTINNDLKKKLYGKKGKTKKSNYFYKNINKDFIVSKNKSKNSSNNYNYSNYNIDFAASSKTSRKNFCSKFPIKISKKEIMKLLHRNKNTRNTMQKLETGIQVNITEKSNAMSQNNNNIKLLKKLIDNSKINNNLEDINYVLESPYRGVEKMGTTLNNTIAQEKDYNFSLPIFLGNNNGFFHGTKILKSKSMPKIICRRKRGNTDKYNEIKKNEEFEDFDSPLKELSKISGVSCVQLRKVIDYSLSHHINNLGYFMKNKYNNDTNRKILSHYIIDNNTNHSNKINKDKSIYSFISLKSRQKNLSDINSNLSNSSKDISFDNVLGKNVFQAKFSNKFHYNQKRYNHAPINLIKDSNLFNNLTIKDKIGAFYK